MITVALIKAKMRNHSILIKVDNQLVDTMRSKYPVDFLANLEFNIPINLYRLIYNIGTIQSLYFEPTNRQKFFDRMYLIEKIHNDNRLMIKIDDIRERLGSEKLRDFSEDFGIGLAVCVADYLYKINPTTIVPIKATNKRPDIRCFTMENEELIIESKGSCDIYTLNRQRANAIRQKRTRTAHIRTASLTLIKENDATITEFIDPPFKPDEDDVERRKRILMAEHYSAVFNFIGQKELSKYYRLMRDKIKNQEDYKTVLEKEELFYKIKDTYSIIELNGKRYFGSVEKVEEKMFTFLGIEERLLYFEGFLHFEAYDEEINFEDQGNHFFVYKDGIIVGEIEKVHPFYPYIDEVNIKHYQEYTTIADIDSMDSFQFEKYLKYLFELNRYEVIYEKHFHEDKGTDLVLLKNKEELFVYIKHFSNPKKTNPNLTKEFIPHHVEGQRAMFVTNVEVLPSFKSNIMVIDRTQLKKIIKKPLLISFMLDNG